MSSVNISFPEGESTNLTLNFPIYDSSSVEPGPTPEGGTTDYSKLSNKPKINNIELSDNKSLDSLGIQPKGDYATSAQLLNVQNELNSLNIPSNTSQLNNDSGFINKSVLTLDNFYNKSYIDSKISSVYRYIATVDTYSQLPTSGMQIGDTYDVRDTGINWAWNGEKWDDLGGIVDLSNLATKAELSEVDNSKVEKVAGKQLSTEDFTTAEKTKLAELSTNESVPVSGQTVLGGLYTYYDASKNNLYQGNRPITMEDIV